MHQPIRANDTFNITYMERSQRAFSPATTAKQNSTGGLEGNGKGGK